MVSSGYFGVNGYPNPAASSVYGVNPLSSNSRTVRSYNVSGTDSFQYSQNSLQQYFTEDYIKNVLRTNPKIRQILAEKGVPAQINMQNLKHIQFGHAADTQEIAKGIIKNLPQSQRYKIDTNAINNASYLHDIGKVFIPDEILNKPAMLEGYEREIMQTHSELGYEILKNSSLDEKTKELVKYHHQNRLGSGYPKTDMDFSDDLNLQILAVADKYSALTEHRAYKSAMTPEKALGIIYADVQKNLVDPDIFRGLVKYLNDKETSIKNKIQTNHQLQHQEHQLKLS